MHHPWKTTGLRCGKITLQAQLLKLNLVFLIVEKKYMYKISSVTGEKVRELQVVFGAFGEDVA